MAQSKNWVFTIQEHKDIPYDANIMSYLVYQPEMAPLTGRRHTQGYIQFHIKQRLTQVKKILPGAHLEIMKGTPEQAANYCKKEDTREPNKTFTEYGSYTSQGERTDFHKLIEDFKGRTFTDAVIANPAMFMKYNRGFTQLYNIIKSKPRQDKTEVIFIWGPSGSGKSKMAWTLYPDAYPKDSSHWWDGYQNQDTVILDDFKYDPNLREYYLKLFDRYPFQVQYKGGYIVFNSKRIVITCSKHPEQAFNLGRDDNEDREFFRRLDSIIYLPSSEVANPVLP